MLTRRATLAGVLAAATAAGGCATAPSAAPAATAVCSSGAAPGRAPHVAASPQPERARTEKDDHLAPVDPNAVASQGHRLQAVGARYPDTFGGVIVDPVAGDLTVRYVNTSHRPAFLKAVKGLGAHRGDVPVRFAEVDQPLTAMRQLARELDTSREWAGPAASCIHEVYVNELAYQLWVDASGAAEQLVEAVRARTGLTPGISISPYGMVPA